MACPYPVGGYKAVSTSVSWEVIRGPAQGHFLWWLSVELETGFTAKAWLNYSLATLLPST